MRRLVWLGVVLALVGCGQVVRQQGEVVWYVRGNALFSTDAGKQQIQVEMYGEKHRFWVMEGRDVFVSGRLFWFLSLPTGTNYVISDIQKLHLFFVDEAWSSLLVEVLPSFLERDESDPRREDGWLSSYQTGGWEVTVKKRFSDGLPRLLRLTGEGQEIFFDLNHIERRPYRLPDYERLGWQQVHLSSHGGIWEVIYE